MPDVLVEAGQVLATPIDVGGTDVVTVVGFIIVSGEPAVTWDAPATGTGVMIYNEGEILDDITASGSPTGSIAIVNTGRISAALPIDLDASSVGSVETVTNYGVISGANAFAIVFGSGSDVFNVVTGSTTLGRVFAASGTGTINLSGAGTGTIYGSSENVNSTTQAATFNGWDGFSTLNVNSGTWTLEGRGYYNNLNIASGATLAVEAVLPQDDVTTANGQADSAGFGPLANTPNPIGPAGNSTVVVVDNGTIEYWGDGDSFGYNPASPDGISLSGFGQVDWLGTGANYINPDQNFVISGGAYVANGTLYVLGSLSANVTIESGGTLQIGGNGTLVSQFGYTDTGLSGALTGLIVDSGTLVIARLDGYSPSGGISFGVTGGTIDVVHGHLLSDPVSDFGLGSVIDFQSVAYKSFYTTTWNQTTGLLSVVDPTNGDAVVATATVNGPLLGQFLTLSPDAGSGLQIGVSPTATAANPEVLFNATASNGIAGLWVTNGTVAGTYELSGIVGANVASGFNVTDMTPLNGNVLFSALASNGVSGLWVTNGTAAGTYELSGIAGANVVSGFDVTDLTPLNGQLLFSGVASNGIAGLWVTDGTLVGTHELTSIAGANVASGFDVTAMTTLNSEVLFSGVGSNGINGLWVTDGTAAGTHELTGIAGANVTSGFNASDMTTLNGQVLFNGVASSGINGLWVTDGTPAGTHEVSGIAGANVVSGFNVTDMTPLNGEVLFSGVDSNGISGLWVTNGTALGTHELTGIWANSAGFNVSDMTAWNGEVLFSAVASNGVSGLWVTDGSGGGTYELTGITGANVSSGFDVTNITPLDGEVLFNGVDSNGLDGLWVTNGTVAGTHELTGVVGVDVGSTLNVTDTMEAPPGNAAQANAQAVTAVQTAVQDILRSTDSPFASTLDQQVSSGQLSQSQAIAQIVQQAESTSSVATLTYEFFTGSPPDAAGMDYLVSPIGPNVNNLNGAYYQSFSLENRYINFAVNLATVGAGEASFQLHFGATDLADATSYAYSIIFGTTPTLDKVDALLNTLVTSNGITETRAEYFAGYGGDGLNGLGTEAAMVGWLLAEAATSNLGDYALSNDAYLTAIAKGTASVGVDLIGSFDQPSFHYTGG